MNAHLVSQILVGGVAATVVGVVTFRTDLAPYLVLVYGLVLILASVGGSRMNLE
jgi:hypothetical protein